MKNTNPDLNQLIGDVSEDNKYRTEFDGVYLFLSFDLVNSTAYKNLNPYWSKIFRNFRDFSSQQMKLYFRPFDKTIDKDGDYCDLKWYVWKNLGDEIIFMFPNPRIEELPKLPDVCCKVLAKINESLITPTRNSPVKVSVKATLWLAAIEEKDKDSDLFFQNEEPSYNERNINIAIKDSDHNMIDFLGPDIDTGFRLSHYASHNKLTIDARLAWILLTKINSNPLKNAILNKAKIVSYKPLKGVWNEKPYPVIWYMENWENENLFYYFEEVDSKNLAYEISNKGYKFEKIEKLETILSDAKQLDYADYLYNKIKEKNGKRLKSLERIYELNKTVEVHLICLCLNEQNEVLILRRSNDRNFLPNVWDFGCTYIKNESSIEESLINGYQLKIGTKIELLEYGRPIKLIQIKRDNFVSTNALVFVGRVDKKKIEIQKEKYSAYKWIPFNYFYPNKQLRKDYKKDFVEGFEERLNELAEILLKNEH